MNSKHLLIKQVRSHADTLSALLESPATAAAPAAVMERCLLATRMLAGTMALMELRSWEALLHAVESLLRRYHDTRRGWDERVAQISSEVIECEETLIKIHEADENAPLDDAVSAQELDALVNEAVVLEEECQEAAPDAAEPGGDGIPLVGLGDALRASSDYVQRLLASESWRSGSPADSDVAELRREIVTVGFYARAFECVLDLRATEGSRAPSTLLPMETALVEYANALARARGRRLKIDLVAGGIEVDPVLQVAAWQVLRHLAADAFTRCEGDDVRLTIEVRREHGATRWRLSDNGENLVSDSQLDHDEHLAFYPGLRHVIRMLAEWHGVLWVEPGSSDERDDARFARFEFSLPDTAGPEPLYVWDSDAGALAVRASQVCSLLPASDIETRKDAYGEFIEVDGRRVTLLRMDTLYAEAPVSTDCVALLGTVEKRVAIYVSGNGQVVRERVTAESHRPGNEFAQIAGRKVRVFGAEEIIRGYLAITGTIANQEDSGGEPKDELETVSHRQATANPPDQPTFAAVDDGVVEVLVVEQSESLRSMLTDILNQSRVRAAFVGDVEEAIAMIDTCEPRVIISEFRMPTLAAKRLADSLRGAGRAIPILVTTSQTGKTADLLVEKLGAAGYLSKPLRPEEVATVVHSYLGIDVAG